MIMIRIYICFLKILTRRIGRLLFIVKMKKHTLYCQKGFYLIPALGVEVRFHGALIFFWHGQKIEIQRPGLEPLIIVHPEFEKISKETEEKPPNLDQPKPKKAISKRSIKKVKSMEQIFLAVVYGGEGKHTYRRWQGKNSAGWKDLPGGVYDIYLLNTSKENLCQVSCEIPGGKVSIDQLHSQSYHQIDTLEDFQFDFINDYYVTYFKKNSDQKYFLEFYLPKDAIFEKHWEDIPLLNQRGFMKTHVSRP